MTRTLGFSGLSLREAQNALDARSAIVHGMKRSGNHAVLRWLRSGDRFAFRNNLLPFLGLHEAGTLDSINHRLSYPLFTRLNFCNRFWTRPRLASLEDMPIDRWLFAEPAPNGIRNVLVWRSPDNLFASRIRKGFATDHAAYPRSLNDVMLRSRRLWIQHAREALNETSHLANKVVIFYDRWLVNHEYRNQVATQLQITPNDASLSVHAREGGGSSFALADVRKTRPEPAADLLNRPRFLNGKELALLHAVLDDAELQRLRAKLMARQLDAIDPCPRDEIAVL